MGERLQAYVTLRWGEVVLASTSVPASRAFVLGRGGDWSLPAEVMGVERFKLLQPVDGGRAVVLTAPPGATAWVDGQASPFRDATEHRLGPGARGCVDLGASVSVHVEVGVAQARLGGRLVLAASALGHHALSAAFHAALLALLALMVPPRDADTLDAEEYADRLAYLVHALDGATGARADAAETTPQDDETARGDDAHARSEDTPAVPSPVATRDAHATPVARQTDAPDAARAAALSDAASFGMIGLVRRRAAPNPARWEREDPGGPPGVALPGMFSAGLFQPSDPGIGGGGDVGIIGVSIFDSVPQPKGMDSSGMSGSIGSHKVRAPRICVCGPLQVNGRLPPETIQRVIHQSFGRFRACYEKELERNPKLEARVDTKLVIGRDGSVAFARSEGPQPVAACVQSAFEALSFPEPAGGTVTVEYPLLLQPDDVPAPAADIER